MSENFVDFAIDINLDTPDIQAWGGGEFPKIDPGIYTFEVANVEQVAQTGGGNPGVKFRFRVIGDATGAECSENGKEAVKTYPLVTKSLGRFKQLLLALEQPLSGFQAGAVLGARFEAEVIHRTMKAQTKPDGTVTEEKEMQDIIGEQTVGHYGAAAVATASPPPPPPEPAVAQTRRAVGGPKAAVATPARRA